MQQWSEYERAQHAALAGPPKQLLNCVECGATWFEIVRAVQIDTNQLSALGQTPSHDGGYSLLKCVRCGETHEPPIIRGGFNQETKAYDNLLDELQEPDEKHGGQRATRRDLPSPEEKKEEAKETKEVNSE
jgi:hypothetical protein